MRLRTLIIVLAAVGLVIGGYVMGRANAEDTEGTKGEIWGNPTAGIALSASFEKPRYALDQPIEVTLAIKNESDTKKSLVRSNSYDQYRIVLFDENGRPVAKSKLVIEEENRPPSPMRSNYRYFAEELAPGQVVREHFTLSNWVIISRPGTYQVLVMRQATGDTWGDAIAISNLATVEITKP